jgi:hypothetical protein
MLQIVKTEQPLRPRRPRPVGCTSVNRVRRLSKCERLEQAALYVLGSIDVRPTACRAAEMFRVNLGALREVIDHLEATTVPVPRLEREWSSAQRHEREAFVRKFADELITILDRVTSPTA